MSVFIPHVFQNINKSFIVKVFENQGIAKVKSIDLVPKISKNGEEYNAAYIHFDYWFTGEKSRNFQDRILNPNKEARIVYDDPWYWVILPNETKKFTDNSGRKLSIMLDSPSININSTPGAPKKERKNNISVNMEPRNLEKEFNIDEAFDKIYEDISEMDKHLVTIDGRYVNELEKESADYNRIQTELEILQHKYNILQDEYGALQGKLAQIEGEYN
jgi:hypothetical protein